MKQLYIVTTAIEAGAGIVLMGWPSVAVTLLLGSGLDTSAAVTLGRVAGVALFALGAACWLARHDTHSRSARGLVGAMVIYNLGVVVILAAAGIRSRPVGVLLWPAVVLHAAMAIWCVADLLRNPTQTV